MQNSQRRKASEAAVKVSPSANDEAGLTYWHQGRHEMHAIVAHQAGRLSSSNGSRNLRAQQLKGNTFPARQYKAPYLVNISN